MNLRHLIELIKRQGTDLEVAADPGTLDREVAAVTNRAGEAGPQVLLVVEPSASSAAVDEALRRGVAALVAEEPLSCPVPVLRVQRSRDALRHLLSLFYGDPAQKLLLWGVTGPGQNTVAFLLHRCLAEAGLSPGLWADVTGSGGLAGRGRAFSAGLLLFLRALAEQGGRSAVLSLCPGELFSGEGAEPALHGLVSLGERQSFPRPAVPYSALPTAPRLVMPWTRRASPSRPESVVRFGLAPGAEVRYRPLENQDNPNAGRGASLWLKRWGQEVEFSLDPRFAAELGLTGPPAPWRVRLATPGPAARRAAAAATAAALAAGSSPESTAHAMSVFPGVYRRCQLAYDGRLAVIDDVAQTPREAAAVMAALKEVEAGLPFPGAGPLYRRLIPVCAVAGGRGAVLNARLGHALAGLLPRGRAHRIIVTEGRYLAPVECATSPEERIAFLTACREGELPVEYHPGLTDALAAALGAAGDGDLVLLLGGPGMNQAQAALADVLAGRSFLASVEPFDEFGGEPFLRPLGLGELTRRANLPGFPSAPQAPRA